MPVITLEITNQAFQKQTTIAKEAGKANLIIQRPWGRELSQKNALISMKTLSVLILMTQNNIPT